MFQDSLYSQFIYKSRYARYLDKERRREEWPETVQRYMDFIVAFLRENNNFLVPEDTIEELTQAILNHDVMPSMRGLMTAGPAAAKNNIAFYNCSFLPIDDFRSFDEEMAILMSGTGVGFSVEQEAIKNLPIIPEEFFPSNSTIVFEDSRIGWAKGYREFISILLIGQIPRYDISKLRPAGSRLKTMGGRSSGPQPLVEVLEFTINLFMRAKGRKLTSIEAHDLACKIADIVVVGGVRRSALISLSDLEDQKMREAKTGNWWQTHPFRRLANNSAIYNEKPDVGTFMKEWINLYNSKSGERGIFSRDAVKNVIENANDFRLGLGIDEIRTREFQIEMGTNPCNEVILLPNEFCNLTSVQIYEDDTVNTLVNKVKIATILGTFQSCLTNFRYLNKKWKRNCENERLLGVSLNGIFDNSLTNGKYNGLQDLLKSFKKVAIETNLEWSKKIGINSSVAITCCKPEGTSSAFNGTSSGIHPSHAPQYIRYVRNDKKDPLTAFMIDQGFLYEEDIYDPQNVVAFKFPIKSSSRAIFKKDVSAIKHLELWKTYQQFYCEHKPSITVSVKENEWIQVGAWVYDNFEWMSGVAFLPAEEENMVYKQAPFSNCTEEEYQKLVFDIPTSVDWSKLSDYELEDMTINQQTLACTGADSCLI